MADSVWVPVVRTHYVGDGDWCFVNLVAIETPDVEQIACVCIAQAFYAGKDNLWFMDPVSGFALQGVTHYMLIVYPEPPEEA